MTQGYYRFPTLHDDTVVFVAEDDLWSIPAAGGVARRLTANPGEAFRPQLSPDGTLIAFTGRDEGPPEIYLMPAAGGPARRLTFLGAALTQLVGWSPDGAEILFASDSGQPLGIQRIYAISPSGGPTRMLPTGPAVSLSLGPQGGMVIARNLTDLARWKRYRGGRTGDLWIDADGTGRWQRLIRLKGNLAAPIWLGERIYFISDHEGVGNLYSCLPSGDELRRHTGHAHFYVRHPSSDGRRIVYHAGADLWIFDPASNTSQPIAIELHSPQSQRKRRFADADRYLERVALHPGGHSLALTARGRAFTMGCWEGAVLQHGDEGGRARLAAYLHDGKRIALLSDASGEEALELHTINGAAAPRRYDDLDLGRALRLEPSPKDDLVALTNQRHELLLVDLKSGSLRRLDRSPYGRISGVAWSPDGRWLAYSYPSSRRTAIIRLCNVESGATYDATRTLLYDSAPAWDPEGYHLYFIGLRDFDPVRDHAQFDWSFPRAARPFLITLRADLPSPFAPRPPDQEPPKKEEKKEKKEEKEEKEEKEKEDTPAASDAAAAADPPPAEPAAPTKDEPSTPPKEEPKGEKPIQIDLDGLPDRIAAFPVPLGLYGQVLGLRGKVLFTSYPLRGAFSDDDGGGRLELYDLGERSVETLLENVGGIRLSTDAKTLLYTSGRRVRVIKAGEKPRENGGYSRKSGWIDLSRVKLSVLPPQEWRQMYREAWRLQRDQFWTEDMSAVDWQAVYTRYLPLLDRVSTRGEFSDLLWEMQGELGTSHAYEGGGDYRTAPSYRQGYLGLDLEYDPEADSYQIARIIPGDIWDVAESSPLARPGLGVRPGDRLLAINGRRLGRAQTPGELLVNQAGAELLLTIAPVDGGEPRTLTVKALNREGELRYRDWVEANRARVHAASDGRVGYVHVPDMQAWGFAEFHRGYLAESTRASLIVDVRYNGGGNVSQLLLEKLSRRRLGYVVSRWGEPGPYPSGALMGPVVAITNERAASDGDIFSHAFKMLGLGPLVGTRTWGGVIGINPVGSLIDGGSTTQPEYSLWFNDVGWGVENYGTDPTIEVEIAPHDYVAGRDPQLERAIAEALRMMEERPAAMPDFGPRPRLGLPELPEV